jgi:hypothetical protein
MSMPETRWLTTPEAAWIFYGRGPAAFLTILTERGGDWVPDAAAPSDRTLRLELAKQDPATQAWLWSRAFMSALGAYLGWRNLVYVAGETLPGEAVDLFTMGVNSIGHARPAWRTDDTGLTGADQGHALYRELLDQRAILAMLSERGIAATVEHLKHRAAALLDHIDTRERPVLYGRSCIVAACQTLAKIGPDHPFVRFGLLSIGTPEDPFPEPLAPRPMKATSLPRMTDDREPDHRAEAMLEEALRPLLAASKITPEQRDRWCLVPEARHDDLLRLVRFDESARDKRGRAMRATGLSNAAVAARATLDELQPVIALQPHFAERMRRMILSRIAQYAAWDADPGH